MTIVIPKGAVVLLLGSKDKVPEVPQTPVKFIEDMNDAEAATAVLPLHLRVIVLSNRHAISRCAYRPV